MYNNFSNKKKIILRNFFFVYLQKNKIPQLSHEEFIIYNISNKYDLILDI